MRGAAVVILVGVCVLAAACGDAAPCDAASDCAPPETATIGAPPRTASPRPNTPQRTPVVPAATIEIGTPSPEPRSPMASLTPAVTPTLIPPLPGTVPTRPPAPTATFRARFPEAADIRQQEDGTYFASVDGCDWDETRRRTDPRTGDILVDLTSDCYEDEWVQYNPATGEVSVWTT